MPNYNQKSFISTPTINDIKQAIESFIKNEKTDKLKKAKTNEEKKELERHYEPLIWLENAQHRSSQLKIVTHLAKSMNSLAKGASGLYILPEHILDNNFISSKVLTTFKSDVTGNAGAIDVYRFVMTKVGDTTLLELIEQNNVLLLQALHPDMTIAQKWCNQFKLMLKQENQLAAHTLTKQLLWSKNNNVHDDADYILILPLHPISLIHNISKKIQTDKFSEDARQARSNKKEQKPSSFIIKDYPNIAEQYHGGNKPWNVSPLTGELGGAYSLLPSLPPTFKTSIIRPIMFKEDATEVFIKGEGFIHLCRLTKIIITLVKQETSNITERDLRDNALDTFTDRFIEWTTKLRTLDPTWLEHENCILKKEHRIWLTPNNHDNYTNVIPSISKNLRNKITERLKTNEKFISGEIFDTYIKQHIETLLLDFES